MGKPNKGKGRNPKGHECNPAMARDGALPHFPSLLTCCFANSIYQSLNWRSLHSCVTTSLGKSFLSKLGQLIIYDCPCWSCSCLAAPCSVDGCWLRERSAGRCNAHGAVPATQNDSVPGPGKLQLVFVSDFFICLTGMLGRLVNTCI